MTLTQSEIRTTPSERVAPLKVIQNEQSLLVHEIFLSLQGESTYAGLPCVFIRTTGCHLRCGYCDTAHAFYKGSHISVEDVITRVKTYKTNLVELTGGEPLLQKNTPQLLTRLCDEGLEVLLETSGAVGLDKVDRRVKVILDVKTPASGEQARNVWKNFKLIWPGCEIKFVICDRNDFEFAVSTIAKYQLVNRFPIHLSPAYETLKYATLAEWIIESRLPVRLNLQLHKIIWGDIPGV